MRVLLLTEGTYPYSKGGVSTWCHELLNVLDDVEFDLYALTNDPTLEPLFPIPANVRVRNVAMWGTRSAWETRRASPFASERRRLRNTDRIPAAFVAALRSLMRETLGAQHDDEALGAAIEALHRLFLVHDMDALMRSEEAWEVVRSELLELLPRVAEANGYPAPVITLEEVADVRRWIAHWLTPLASPLPVTDVVHAAMAGTCTLIAVAAQRVHGAASVLSEHGIYLREAYLWEQRAEDGLTGKLVRLGFARRMTELHYATADCVAPCCEYNRRWEERYGVEAERIRTVYTGLDATRFPVVDRGLRDAPVVVWAGRIDPLKDVETLLRAAALVVAERPEVTFKLYGSAHPTQRAYDETCRQLWRELELEGSVFFEGWTSSTADAFAEADIVALTSISEGFPFSTLEALLCGRPVVATAVGGVPEQITDACGLVVPPRDARAVADAVLELLADPVRWQERSDAARAWASESFGIDTFEAAHRSLYADATIYAAAARADAEAAAANGKRKVKVKRNGAHATTHNGNGNGHGNGHVNGNGHANGNGNGNGNAGKRRATTNGNGAHRTGAPLVVAAESSTVALAAEGANIALAAEAKGVAVLDRPAARRPRAMIIDVEMVDPTGELAERLDTPLDDLVAQIAGRLRMPLHADEATATLESLGVTDAVAEGSYGSADTFTLAHSLWPRIREIAAQHTAFGTPPPKTARSPIIDAAIRGATALAPLGALFTVIGLFAAAGWPASQLLALSAGITLALVLSAGPATAMVFRAQILIGVGHVHAADRFLLRTCGACVGVAFVVMLALLPVTLALDISNTDRLTFCGALGVASAIWMLMARLVAGGRAGVAGLCLIGGLLAGVAYAQVTGGGRHAAFSGAAGAGVACALALGAGGAPPNASRRYFQVPRWRLALELFPFARYGLLALLVVVAPHVGAWVAAARTGHMVSAVGDFEIGTTLALFPAMIASALVAVSSRRVWEIAVNMQHGTRADQPGILAHTLRTHHAKSLRRFALVVTVLSLIEAGIVALIMPTGAIEKVATLHSHTTVAVVFGFALFAFASLGAAQLSAGYAMGLANPRSPGRAALAGVVVGLVVSLALALLLGPAWAVGGLVAGTLAFATLAVRSTDRLLEGAAYHYATVF